MHAAIAHKLAEALESGDYARTSGADRIENGFCPLGILIDLWHKETGQGEWVEPRFAEGEYRFVEPEDDDGYSPFTTAGLTPKVKEWAGVDPGDIIKLRWTFEHRDVLIQGLDYYLSTLNDLIDWDTGNFVVSWDEIAQLLREQHPVTV